MPKLGMAMEEGAVVLWPKKIGDRVEPGETVVVIEHDKAEAEVEARAPGFLRHVYVDADPDERVPCGTLLAALTETAEEPFDAERFGSSAALPRAAVRPRGSDRAQTPAPAPSPPLGAGRHRLGDAPVAPAARALAKKLGLDLTQVPGGGPGGRVRKEDVESWYDAHRTQAEPGAAISLEASVEGRGDPVLMLPGFGSDASAFALQTPVLSRTRCVRVVYARGVDGPIARDEEGYPVAALAHDAAAYLEDPTHVVGASLGAAVAIELALLRPEKVRSLTLITPFVRASARLLAVIESWRRVARRADPETLAHLLLPWLFSPTCLADDARRSRLLRGLTQMAARVPPATLDRTAAGLRAWSGTREGDLGELRRPVLLITGTEDLLAPDAGALAGSIAGSRVVEVSGAGHAVALEAPEVVNDALSAHFAAALG